MRRAVGYLRYDSEEELFTLNELYRPLRLYTNFFQPTMKLIEKTRIGSKIIKKYDKTLRLLTGGFLPALMPQKKISSP